MVSFSTHAKVKDLPSAPNTDPILADQIGGKETSGTFERKVRQTVSLLVRFSLL